MWLRQCFIASCHISQGFHLQPPLALSTITILPTLHSFDNPFRPAVNLKHIHIYISPIPAYPELYHSTVAQLTHWPLLFLICPVGPANILTIFISPQMADDRDVELCVIYHLIDPYRTPDASTWGVYLHNCWSYV